MKKLIAMLLAAALVLTVFAGCGKTEPAAEETTAAPAAEGTAPAIKIGVTGPLTGDNSEYGLAVRGGMEIAVAEINAKGGLQIEFKAEDDEADGSDKAVSAYNALKDWGMQIFAGAVTTGSSLAIAPETVNDQIFMLTPSASAEDVALTGPNVYQMCFTDPNQGAAAADLMKEKWPDATIGVIYDSSDAYSSGIVDGFLSEASELGLNVAVSDAAFTQDNKADLSTQVTKCKDAGCDLVFLPFYYTEASQVLTYANTIGYTPTFFGCDGMDGILNVEGFDTTLAEGLALMTPFDANAESAKSFVDQFKANNGGKIPNQFAADGYDVIYAIYNACVAAGVDGSTPAADVCAALQEQFATMTVDGLTGTNMTWDENGMISKTPIVVVIENGAYVPMA
ncbi:MAG TPA: ABC transporter substrate-binding protein [Candidatus Faecousia faecipullorum]|nr:ABC transporter substrate-binding protein [Candidatus Faecousia faecipullorum]